jgi:hypothetical protein
VAAGAEGSPAGAGVTIGERGDPFAADLVDAVREAIVALEALPVLAAPERKLLRNLQATLAAWEANAP